jgi:hypothetical protein
VVAVVAYEWKVVEAAEAVVVKPAVVVVAAACST